jgi:hypothetical protein
MINTLGTEQNPVFLPDVFPVSFFKYRVNGKIQIDFPEKPYQGFLHNAGSSFHKGPHIICTEKQRPEHNSFSHHTTADYQELVGDYMRPIDQNNVRPEEVLQIGGENENKREAFKDQVPVKIGDPVDRYMTDDFIGFKTKIPVKGQDGSRMSLAIQEPGKVQGIQTTS